MNRIDEMSNGNVESIISGIYSDSSYTVLNAIIAGTKNNVSDKKFIEGVKKAVDDETTFLGIPLYKFAIASLHCLGVKMYIGSDKTIKEMIGTKFQF